MQTRRQENYNSGQDIVLEYGDLRFTFNELDFAERCEQASRKLEFTTEPLELAEREDLVSLAIFGEISSPMSPLGEHIHDCWPDLMQTTQQTFIHWLRRIVFRSAWLDQRVKEGELDIAFCNESWHFEYVQPGREHQPVRLDPPPSWAKVAYPSAT